MLIIVSLGNLSGATLDGVIQTCETFLVGCYK